MQTVFKKIQENAEKKVESLENAPDYMAKVREEIEIFVRET